MLRAPRMFRLHVYHPRFDPRRIYEGQRGYRNEYVVMDDSGCRVNVPKANTEPAREETHA